MRALRRSIFSTSIRVWRHRQQWCEELATTAAQLYALLLTAACQACAKHCFTHVLLYADPPCALQWQKNVSRVCDNIVTDECLLAKGAETCVNDLIDQVLAAELRQGGAAALRPPLIAVAVVVPVVAVGKAGSVLQLLQGCCCSYAP